MELSEFIKDTLVSIKKGIHGANEHFAQEAGGASQKPVFVLEKKSMDRKIENYVSFDIAVTVGQESGQSAKVGIAVFSAGLGGGLSASDKQEQVSKIKFHVLVDRDIA